ncbi:hypothetical protein [Roseateles asaccharophilus]|uniref:Mercuric ion transport protein n=1 Tax=Roseateles asaccharophilus TaxID=582607 RepID=A0ABU2AFA4_9BURK|nr:hypothetical protein [Roseateles asaccharophilus]MDR7335864.1 hypothetical protein [Roseateles asaccharophilus]
MKSWKLALGLGAACAACCTIPLLGGAAIAASAAALWACADELLPLALLLPALSVLWVWRRRRVARRQACACTTACATGGDHACR